MLTEILELNAQAAARGEYETAFHLLMAALHVADCDKNLAVLERITTLAKEQGQAVERAQPPHHLSRYQAQTRGQTAVFDSLVTHIDAVRLRLKSEQQRTRRPS